MQPITKPSVNMGDQMSHQQQTQQNEEKVINKIAYAFKHWDLLMTNI